MANELAPCFSVHRPLSSHALTGKVLDAVEVWGENLDVELASFLAAVASAGPDGVVAIDTEFPGFVRQVPQYAASELQYAAARVNVQLLTPIQLGFAVADGEGSLLGVWNFNLRFDASTDLHLESALTFLTSAGLDLRRHANPSEGIECAELGQRMGASLLAMREAARGPCWVTFSGLHDLGYFLKILQPSQRSVLPATLASFRSALDEFCPQRCELKDVLPYGSLENWMKEMKVPRVGKAHTAGSDALATLMIYDRICGRALSGASVLPCSSPASPPLSSVLERAPWRASRGLVPLRPVSCAH